MFGKAHVEHYKGKTKSGLKRLFIGARLKIGLISKAELKILIVLSTLAKILGYLGSH